MNRASPIVALCSAFWVATLAGAATLTVDPTKRAQATTFAALGPALKQLRAGDTLLIADGAYRETIDLRLLARGSGAQPDSRPTIIAAAPGARPVIKGSDLVTGWLRIDDGVYAKREWHSNSQQVFVDGKPLKQIAGVLFGGFPLNPSHPLASLHRSQGGVWPGRSGEGRSDLVDDSFYYDIGGKVLYIRSRTDIRKASVEVSVRPYLVIGTQVEGIELRGLSFEHANTTAESQSGALTLIGNRLTLESLDIRNVDGAGLDITGDDNFIVDSRANHCGSVGMKVRGRDARLVNNETSFNNTRGFNKWWEAGGAKFVGAGGLQSSEIRGHRAYANNGDGLWFDWHNDNNRVHDSIVAYNRGMGIHYEASHRAWFHDNFVVGNTQRGIYLPNSSDSKVEHNLIAANGMEGLVFVDERGAAKNGKPELIPSHNRVTGNVIAWNGRAALVLPPATRELDNTSDNNVFVAATPPVFSLGWPSREQPQIRSLDEWRKRASQDGASVWRTMGQPPGVGKRIDTHERFPAMYAEWRELLDSLASSKPPTVERIAATLTRLNQLAEPTL